MTDAERAEAFEKFWQESREKAANAVIVSGWRSIETVEEVAREAFYAGVGVKAQVPLIDELCPLCGEPTERNHVRITVEKRLCHWNCVIELVRQTIKKRV